MASNSNESNFTRRVSSRLRDQGVEPRPIDPQCSVLRDSTCPSGQVPSSSARYGDPDNIDHALIESETRCIETSAEIGMNAGVHQSGGNQTEEQSQAAMDSHPQANIRPPSMTPPGLPAPSRTQASVRPPSMTPPRDQPNPSGLPRQSDPPQQNSPLSNYGPPPRVTGPLSNISIPPARNSPMPSQLQLPLNNLNMGYSLQNNMRPPIQVQPQEQSDEEIVQGIKDLKVLIRRAKLKEEFRKLQEELHELGSPNPSTRTNCYIATQGRQNSYMDPQNQVPQTSKAQDLPRSQVTSRPPPNNNRPLVEQGGLCVRENFEQSVRSPIYSQHQPEDSRYNITAGTFGGTPRTTTSHLHQLMRRDSELMNQIGYIKRDTDQLKLKLQHFEKIADEYNIQSDQDLYRLLETLVTWKERESFTQRYRTEERNYRTLKKFLMSGQERVSNILLPRTERGAMSSRELDDEINHWLAEFRNEGVLEKFVTIHLAPPHLKNRLREKLHLCESDFRNAWKVMLDTDEQDAKVRARNVNYLPAPHPNRNRPGRTQQQWRANNDEIICRNHQRFGKNTHTCLDNRCTMRNQTISPLHAKNALPNFPQ